MNIESEEPDFQYFEELGEGLCDLLVSVFGGESFPVAAQIIEWLRHEASPEILAEIATMMVEQEMVVMSAHAPKVGWLDGLFASHIRDSMDRTSITSYDPG